MKIGSPFSILFCCSILVNFCDAQEPTESSPLRNLTALLESENSQIRQRALHSIRDLGIKTETLVSRLHTMMRTDPASEVRIDCVNCLVGITSYEHNRELFLEALRHDENLSVRMAAAHAIDAGEGTEKEVVSALNKLAEDLRAAADLSAEMKKWLWRIGWSLLAGLLVLFAVGLVRYIVFRDLRRTLITAALAYAFLPQIGVTILSMYVEYLLYGKDRGPGIVSILGALTSATVIVFAMFFIDRQDARRQSAAQELPDNEWDVLSAGINAFCGLSLTPKTFVWRLVRQFSIPAAFVERRNLDADAKHVITTAVRDTLWRIIDTQMGMSQAVSQLIENAAPHVLEAHESVYLLTNAKHHLLGIQESPP